MIIAEYTNNIHTKPKKIEHPVKGASYLAWRDKVAQELQDRHHFDEAERWDYCDNSPRYIIGRNETDLPPSAEQVYVCSQASDHDAVLFSPTCDYRICPDCSKRHTARFMSRFLPALKKLLTLHPEYRLRSLTFTTRKQLGSAGFKEAATNGFDLIQKSMLKTVGKKWNKNGAGMLANWEVGTNGNKLHYHCIYFGPWVDQKILSSAWHDMTGDSFVVWVAAIKHNDGNWQGAVSEVLKYATKFYSEDKETGERIYLSPSLTADLFEALKGTRRIRAWGSLYNIGEPSERVFCCSVCDSKMVRLRKEYFEIWRETGFSEEGWKTAIRSSLLQYRTADKLGGISVQSDNHDKPTTYKLPFMDKMPIPTRPHYDYE